MADSRYSPVVWRGFEAVFGPWRRGHLRTLPLAGVPSRMAADVPLVLVANHVSWWDGFLLRDVQRLVRPRAPLYTLMDADQLRAHPIFRWMGAVGVDAGSAGSVAQAFGTIRRRARERRDTVISFFPQGKIWPSWRRPLGFARGVHVLLRRIGPTLVLPVGIHLEPLNRAAPTAFVSIGPPLDGTRKPPDVRWMEAAVETELERIAAFLGRWGEAAPDRWPPDPARGGETAGSRGPAGEGRRTA